MEKIIKQNLKLVFVAFLLLFFGCKKYDEGPLLSLRTKTARVTGTWEVEYLGINGTDSTQIFKNSVYYARYVFIKNSAGDELVEYLYTNISGIHKSEWYFGSRKGYKHELYVRVGLAGCGSSFLIKRLTDKQMWLEGTTYSGKSCYLKLKKIKK